MQSLSNPTHLMVKKSNFLGGKLVDDVILVQCPLRCIGVYDTTYSMFVNMSEGH